MVMKKRVTEASGTRKRTNISITEETDARAKALEAMEKRTRSGLFAALVDRAFDEVFRKPANGRAR